MGRGRTKGKKLVVTNHDDPESGEEETVHAQKRRGRPQKSLKDDIIEDETQNLAEEDSEDTNGGPEKDTTNGNTTQNGKKRKINVQVKEKANTVKEENGNATRSSTEELNKLNGFRHRRKNKPCRAAGAVVECN